MSLFTRLSALALAGLVAIGAAGCDSSGTTAAATAGPVVQFGTNSRLATEGLPTESGTTVSIPVSLTGSTGQPVSVEILFARSASTAAFNADSTVAGTDITGFGTSDGGVQKATVSFDGTADETKTVTFRVLQDNVFESSETAVFALQRPVGASIGTTRELTVNIGTPPISTARAGTLGQIYTVEGIVTRALGRNTVIQDATGGIVLFGPAGSPIATAVADGSLRRGDRVQATGRFTEFQATTGAPGTGLLEIDNIALGGFQVLARDQALPAAQTITLAQFTAGDPDSDTYESELVRVTGLTIDPGTDVVFAFAKNYTVSQTVGGVTTTAILRIGSSGDSNAIGQPIPTGTFTFEGVAGQFRGANQLTVVRTTDLIPQ